jgi:hypothetical protein
VSRFIYYYAESCYAECRGAECRGAPNRVEVTVIETVTNTLAYSGAELITAVKSFEVVDPSWK